MFYYHYFFLHRTIVEATLTGNLSASGAKRWPDMATGCVGRARLAGAGRASGKESA
jgi:hypothetical protein